MNLDRKCPSSCKNCYWLSVAFDGTEFCEKKVLESYENNDYDSDIGTETVREMRFKNGED